MRLFSHLAITASAMLFATAASAQVAADTFDTANTHDWGVEFGTPAPHMATGGNPGGRILVEVSNTNSNLPGAMIVPDTAGHPWRGDFRALGVEQFSFDRQVEAGFSNFGTTPYLVLGNDNGTRTNFSDDTLVYVATGDSFQMGFEAWASFDIVIPSQSASLPAGWTAGAFPSSPANGADDNFLWTTVIEDVDYVGIAMDRPINALAWFGTHFISFDNFELSLGQFAGTNYCDPSVVNTSGVSARIGAAGTPLVAANNFTLTATGVPPMQFGIFLASTTSDFNVGANGSSDGNLCLGGNIGRFNLPNQILAADSSGAFDLNIDLNQIPQGSQLVSISAGQTWFFQAWFRDFSPMGSNFTDGLEVTFN